MSDDNKEELKAAYEELDQAVRKIVTYEGIEGLVTDYVTVAAVQKFDTDGVGLSMVARILPDGGTNIPPYRLMGLLDYAKQDLVDDVFSPITFHPEDEDDE